MEFRVAKFLFFCVVCLLPCLLKAHYSQERISTHSHRETYEVIAICSARTTILKNLNELGWKCKQLSIRQSLRDRTYLSSSTDIQQLEVNKRDFYDSRLVYIEGIELQNLCVLERLIGLTKNLNIPICLDLSKRVPNLPIQTLFTFIRSHVDILILSKKSLSNYTETLVTFPSKTTITYGKDNQGWIQKGQRLYRFQSSNPSLFTSGILHGMLRQKSIEHCLGFAQIINRSYDTKVQSLSESAWKEIRKILKANEK